MKFCIMEQNKLFKPFVQIIEQPDSKGTRFRYECEGRSSGINPGSITGISSTNKRKTFPAIKVVGYRGKAIVVVSCVTKDKPHRPHPHNLVGKEGACKKGVCTMEIDESSMIATFSNLGIQCVKKKDIEQSLNIREQVRVDPFKTGFQHKFEPGSIDLNSVRLCFQVFIYPNGTGPHALKPVVTEPIYNKKFRSELNIVKLSDCVSYVDGSTKDIILLCGKVVKEDIQVRFYEIRKEDGVEIWESYANLQPHQVHKQAAIWFRAPRYQNLDITEPVQVFIQLKRPSDGETSQSLPFEYLPITPAIDNAKRKRQRMEESGKNLDISLEPQQVYRYDVNYGFNIPFQDVKREPQEGSPQNGVLYSEQFSPEIAKPDPHRLNMANNLSMPAQCKSPLINPNSRNSSPYNYSEDSRTPYTPAAGFSPQTENAEMNLINLDAHTMQHQPQPHCSGNNNINYEHNEGNYNIRNNFTTDPNGGKTNSSIAMSANDILLNSHELQNYWPDISDLTTSFSDINISKELNTSSNNIS